MLDQNPSAEEIVYGQKTVPDARHLYTDLSEFRKSLSILLHEVGRELESIYNNEAMNAIKRARGEKLLIDNFVADPGQLEVYCKNMYKDIEAYNECIRIIDERMLELMKYGGWITTKR
ncbi:hypothetical protein [Bacteroides acidifaciens]|uniref:hypothetical protein n=1 Tax=Bacteroides acidifaciens TaxID=85831 RepID=UPI0026E97A6E|nr:hypothetical protein [Bacteroides acidifaciens]